MKKIIICFLLFLSCLFAPLLNVHARNDNIEGDGGIHIPEEVDPPSMPDIPTTDYNRDDDFAGNCEDLAPTLAIGGKLIFVAKILLPLIIIVKSTMDLSKVVISGSNSEIPKQAKKIGISLVAGILIFYIPILINSLFNLINGFEDKRTEDSKICSECILNVYGDYCKNYLK